MLSLHLSVLVNWREKRDVKMAANCFKKQQKSTITHTHTHTHIYIYICIFRQHFFVNANFIKHNRYLMSTYFLLDPFEFPYYFYRIRGELIYVLSIVVCIPSTFCLTLGHHQGRIYYKSDVTFVLAYYYIIIELHLKANAIIFNGKDALTLLSLWYDLTWDWTLISRTISEHPTH